MEFFNLLADVPISLMGETFDISLNWIGRIVRAIISSGVGVGIGVILFSLILKVIVLPFDIFQRISMRKQNIKMKENKDKMEKLQKQYANDKKMYNQKLMEMQKQSGLTLLSSCLPMILSMVIFFVAIGAFNAYAKFSSVENYNTLVNAYKGAVNEYVVDLDENSLYAYEDKYVIEVSKEDNGKTVLIKTVEVAEDEENFYTSKTGEELQSALKEAIRKQYIDETQFNEQIPENSVYTLRKNDYIKVSQENKLIYCLIPTESVGATADALKTEALAYTGYKYYFIENEAFKTHILTQAGFIDENGNIVAGKEAEAESYFETNYPADIYESKAKAYFDTIGAIEAEKAYQSDVAPKTKFLWIKNVWATDATYKHPVLSHKDFLQELAAASCGSSCSSNGSFIVDGEEITVSTDGALVKNDVTITNVYEENAYNKVTAKLGEQKDQSNGYYVLIVLSIGTILLQQWITMRSQKEQQKYSSVDGQGASTQKMTMIIMTVMFAAFSFMYSSAFSIYMVMSNLFSLASTLLINKFVDIAEHKKEQKALQEKYNQRLPQNRQNNDKKGKNANKNNKKK